MMVVREKFKGDETFRCEECDIHYHTKKMAVKCEKHCRENNACSLEITIESVERS